MGIDWASIGTFITGAGFAAVVALWFMFRAEKYLAKLTEAIEELSRQVGKWTVPPR